MIYYFVGYVKTKKKKNKWKKIVCWDSGTVVKLLSDITIFGKGIRMEVLSFSKSIPSPNVRVLRNMCTYNAVCLVTRLTFSTSYGRIVVVADFRFRVFRKYKF